jgi:hypothetical protein
MTKIVYEKIRDHLLHMREGMMELKAGLPDYWNDQLPPQVYADAAYYDALLKVMAEHCEKVAMHAASRIEIAKVEKANPEARS